MPGRRATTTTRTAEPDLGPPPELPDSDLIPPEQIPEEVHQRVATDEQEAATVGEEVTELTDDERLWFSTLLTVGRRSKPIDVMGHTVVIQNLNVDDDLRVGLYCREFQGAPPADQRAYQLAVCAAGIRSVDGFPLVSSLIDQTESEQFDAKVAALRRYYPVVITQIYREILGLDAEFYELATKLGKLKG